MASLTLKNRLGGVVTFSDAFKVLMNQQGSTGEWSHPTLNVTGETRGKWTTYYRTNIVNFINLKTSLITSNNYYISNLGSKIVLPLKPGTFGDNFNDLSVVADLIIVNPGENTQAQPGYSLRIYGGRFLDHTVGAYECCNAYVGYKIFSIAGNQEIATIYPNGNGWLFSRFMWSVPSIFDIYPDYPDNVPYLYLWYDNGALRFCLAAAYSNGSSAYTNFGFCFNQNLFIDNNLIKNTWGLTTENTPLDDAAIDPEYGNYSTAGGYKPSFDDSSDTIPIPAKPSLGVTSTGFQNVYIVTAGDIASIGSEIFPIPTAGTDVLSALNSLIDVQSSTNLSNYVVDCRILPVAAANTGVNTNISIAGRTLNSTGKPVTDDYVDVDCGSVSIPERYGNFADYEPYTTAKLYLPFVGFVPVHIEFLKKLQVKYRFNVIDGSFVVYVLATSDKSELNESVVGQYAGCACVHIPFSGLDYANFNRQVAGSIVGTISGVVNTAAGLATGNLAQATKGGAGIISGISQGVSAKPDYQQSNAYTGSTSFMTVRTPYLLIGRPEPQFSANYPKENGLPLNVKKTLSSCSGFTVCGDVVVSGINCTDIEKEMIVNELKAGVIL